jgi:hypothetical protein
VFACRPRVRDTRGRFRGILSLRSGGCQLRLFVLESSLRLIRYMGDLGRGGIDEYQSEASVLLPNSAVEQAASSRTSGAIAGGPAMPVPSEPFAAVYEDRNRLGVIVARTGRGGFEAYAADNHCLGLFPTPREAAAAIAMARPWVARMTAEHTSPWQPIGARSDESEDHAAPGRAVVTKN